MYISQLGTWYDARSHSEVLSSSVMAKIESSISTAGLTGVDKLLAFLIVTELQVSTDYIFIRFKLTNLLVI